VTSNVVVAPTRKFHQRRPGHAITLENFAWQLVETPDGPDFVFTLSQLPWHALGHRSGGHRMWSL